MTFRELANIIFIEILYEYRNLFEVYPFNNKEFKTAKKTPQRFEICSRIIDSLLPFPAKALFARRYFPLSYKKSAEVLMKAAIDFLNRKYEETKKSIEFVAGYPSKLGEDSFLDKVYKNLELTGNETLLESYRELSKFQRFIQLIELNREELDAFRIVQNVGNNVFSCSLVKLKYLCENCLRKNLFN